MQHQSARQSYIQAEVYTATPQKLQLLLVEAAIKNVLRTQLLWKDQKYDAAFETLTRAQDIVAEILCSLDVEKAPDIAKKLASVYIFIFRRLTEGGMTHDSTKLDDALRILNSERETWRLVCEKFGSTLQDTATLATDKAQQNDSGWASSTPVPTSNIKTSSVQLDLSSNNTQRTVTHKTNAGGGWDA